MIDQDRTPIKRLIWAAFVLFGFYLIASSYQLAWSNSLSQVKQQAYPTIEEISAPNGDLIPNGGTTSERLPVATGFASSADVEVRLFFDGSGPLDNPRIASPPELVTSLASPQFVWEYPLSGADSLADGTYAFVAREYADSAQPVENAISQSDPYTITVSPHQVQIFFATVSNSFARLGNNDFSSGFSGWQVGDLNGYGYGIAEGIFSGKAARLGTEGFITDAEVPVGYGEMRRRLSIPSEGAVLNFDYRIDTYDVIFSEAQDSFYDTLEIYINAVGDENGKTAERVSLCSAAQKGQPVTPTGTGLVFCDGHVGEAALVAPPNQVINIGAQIDLSNYAGENIDIIIRVYNRVDRFYNTYAYLDNFVLTKNSPSE